jgi:hypothetical protein
MYYEITEFNERRLSRGEQYCFRANMIENNEIINWVWLSMKDIVNILKSNEDTISVHEKFSSEIGKYENWNKLW